MLGGRCIIRSIYNRDSSGGIGIGNSIGNGIGATTTEFWMCEDEATMDKDRKKLYKKNSYTDNPDIHMGMTEAECPGRVGSGSCSGSGWGEEEIDLFYKEISLCGTKRGDRCFRLFDGRYCFVYNDSGKMDNLAGRMHCVVVGSRGGNGGGGCGGGGLNKFDLTFVEGCVRILERGIYRSRVEQNGGELAERKRLERIEEDLGKAREIEEEDRKKRRGGGGRVREDEH